MPRNAPNERVSPFIEWHSPITRTGPIYLDLDPAGLDDSSRFQLAYVDWPTVPAMGRGSSFDDSADMLLSTNRTTSKGMKVVGRAFLRIA